VGFEGTAGIQGVGKGVGLSEVPPGVVEFVFLLPVFEAVGFDEGEEVDAELGFAAAGEFEEGDGNRRICAGQSVEQAFAYAGGVSDEVRDLSVLKIGEEQVGE